MYINPWMFNNEPFDDCGKNAGFVYLIVDTESKKKYLGKKFFWSTRKVAGQRKRVTKESDWRKYYGSCEEIKEIIKASGTSRFRRFILSVHKLERDVNYTEVKMQFQLGVLEEVDPLTGESLWYNGNINSRYFLRLVKGIRDRSVYSEFPTCL